MSDPYLHIEEYINGTLSKDDKVAFESAMQSDDRLKQAVEDFDIVGLIGEALIEDEISKIVLDELENSSQPNTKNIQATLWKWVAAASLLFILGWWSVDMLVHKPSQPVFADLYIEPTWPQQRNDNRTEQLSIFLSTYKLGETQIAIDSLKTIGTDESKYWLAELYLKEKKYDSTLLILDLDVTNDIKTIRDRKLFVQVMALYFSGKVAQAKIAIESLPEDMDDYYLKRLNPIFVSD